MTMGLPYFWSMSWNVTDLLGLVGQSTVFRMPEWPEIGTLWSKYRISPEDVLLGSGFWP